MLIAIDGELNKLITRTDKNAFKRINNNIYYWDDQWWILQFRSPRQEFSKKFMLPQKKRGLILACIFSPKNQGVLYKKKRSSLRVHL